MTLPIRNKVLDTYVYDGDPVMGTLCERYQALLRAAQLVESAVDVVVLATQRRVSGGQRPTGQLKDQALFLERERAFEAAQLSLNVVATRLRPLIRPLRDEAELLRALDRDSLGDRMLPKDTQRSHLRANVLTAEALCDAASEYSERYVRFILASRTDELFADPSPTEREWVVQTSGHGSPYLFHNGDQYRVPEGPYLTHAEANAEALRLDYEFTCCGARSRVYNVRTGKWLMPKFVRASAS